MSREIRRVPLDFDFPIGETWTGYLRPDSLDGQQCRRCEGRGDSPQAKRLHDRWYGYIYFDPSETGSARLTPTTPEVRAFAERNVGHSPDFYGSGELATVTEATRLCRLWNGMWSHHLAQEDVDVLVEAGRLMDFTHRWAPGDGWTPIDPPPVVTADQVNRWSLSSFGHDAINCWVVIRETLKRRGESVECWFCDGRGSFEAYPGQRAEAEAWTATGPPTGDGYQLWQTVTEGGPSSPVFATPEHLADWIIASGSRFDGSATPRDQLIAWIAKEGSSIGSFASVGGQIVSGVELAATVEGDR